MKTSSMINMNMWIF